MNPYEIMYVVPKDQYRALVSKSPLSHGDSQLTPRSSHSSLADNQSSLCPVDGRDFKHLNILAHNMKEHTGPKCNICGKTFKHRASLRKHLKRHTLQAGPGAGPSIGPRAGPPEASAGPTQSAAPPPELHCSVCNKKMKHKRNLTRHMKSHKSSFQLKAPKWETL